MALQYHDILASAALRINGLVGVQPAALNTTFLVRPLTQTQFQSTVFPFEACKYSLRMAEEKLCQAVANTGNHPWRNYLTSTTANLVHKATLPSLTTGSKQIIGIWGSVYDGSDGRVCTEKPLQAISRRVDNPGTFYKVGAYWYKIDGQRIYHTRTNVKIDCCFYDGDAQATAIDGNTAVLLPYALEEAYISGTVAMLVRDDEFTKQASQYAAYFKDTLDSISQGLTSVSSKVIPAPQLTANAA